MRGVKAEGGWAVVCTEQVEIHPTSRHRPVHRIAGSGTTRTSRRSRASSDKIHERGALAGIELAHNGLNSPNLISREAPLGPRTCRSSRGTTTRCRRAR